MRARPHPALAVILLLVAASCAAPEPGRAERPEAQRHADARFLVRYDGHPYRVDVRFIDIISESVIAVREGGGGDGAAGRDVMRVEPSVTPPPPETPFAEEAWRAVAVDIADAITGRPPICEDDSTMRLALNDEREARALYRDNRRAWVVFAFCPPGSPGASS